MLRQTPRSRRAGGALRLLFALSVCSLACASPARGQSGLFVVSPGKPDIFTMGAVYRSVQSSTEYRFPSGSASPHRLEAGVRSFVSGRANLVDLPLSYSFRDLFSLQADIPYLTFEHSSEGGDRTETGVGDVSLTLKFKGELLEDSEMHYLISATFPTGDEEKGVGGGTYQFSYTQKFSTWIADYRTTLMAGVTIPKPGADVRVGDGVVRRKPVVSGMAAVERLLGGKGRLLASLRLTAIHTFNSRFDGVSQENSLTALDLVPGISYLLFPGTELNLAAGVPVLTRYDLPGARNRRNPFLNVGISQSF